MEPYAPTQTHILPLLLTNWNLSWLRNNPHPCCSWTWSGSRRKWGFGYKRGQRASFWAAWPPITWVRTAFYWNSTVTPSPALETAIHLRDRSVWQRDCPCPRSRRTWSCSGRTETGTRGAAGSRCATPSWTRSRPRCMCSSSRSWTLFCSWCFSGFSATRFWSLYCNRRLWVIVIQRWSPLVRISPWNDHFRVRCLCYFDLASQGPFGSFLRYPLRLDSFWFLSITWSRNCTTTPLVFASRCRFQLILEFPHRFWFHFRLCCPHTNCWWARSFYTSKVTRSWSRARRWSRPGWVHSEFWGRTIHL